MKKTPLPPKKYYVTPKLKTYGNLSDIVKKGKKTSETTSSKP